MKNFLKTTILPLSLALPLILGCQAKEEQPTRENTLSQGFQKMDVGDYDGAIAYFSDLIEKDPHHHVKLALASSYAGRAGVRIQQIYSFLKVQGLQFEQIKIPSQLSTEKQLNTVMLALSHLTKQWEPVVEVNGVNRGDLLSAIKVLEGDTNSGVRVYSAVLRVIVLKSALKEGLESYQLRSRQRLCVEDMRDFLKWSSKVLDALAYIAMDLEISFPENRQTYASLRLGLESFKENIVSLPVKGDSCR